MISEKMKNALMTQMNKEFYSAYLYMAMSSACTAGGLKGFAKWFMVQYHEEMFHGMKFMDYVHKQGFAADFKPVEGIVMNWKSQLEMFEKTLEHEKFVTKSINDLINLAIDERDHGTQIFLQWYVTEQIEEEDNDNAIIAQLRMINGNPQGLMMLDKELGMRTTTVPTDYSLGLAMPAAAAP